MSRFSFYEFFAGGGMARLGLGAGWECLFANDSSEAKAEVYRQNFPPAEELLVRDVGGVKVADLKGVADLAWASFPCQDLSLAGSGAGLGGMRSGTFWAFWNIIEELRKERRAPRLVVLENVAGTLTSHGGRDFESICGAFASTGYRFGPLLIDAVKFVPQSRPRIFFVGLRSDLPVFPRSIGREGQDSWLTPTLRKAVSALPGSIAKHCVWWQLPLPAARTTQFSDLLEAEPTGVKWHSKAETQHLFSLMSDLNRAKVRQAQESGVTAVGTIYRRTRPLGDDQKTQRAEVRFDKIAGCLRTPGGGSSRQTLLVVDKRKVRSRLLSPREAARLMGLPDTYQLPANYNAAYHVTGDGVVVPVVSHLESTLLTPLLSHASAAAVEDAA